MPRSADNTVLRKILDNPKFAEYNPGHIEEAYAVMLQLAPRLALIEAIAGHWVRTVLVATFISVEMVQTLCDAELAYGEANEMGIIKRTAEEAFLAGAEMARHEAERTMEPVSVAHDVDASDFESWWSGGKDNEEEE